MDTIGLKLAAVPRLKRVNCWARRLSNLEVDKFAARQQRELPIVKQRIIKLYMEALRHICRVRLCDPDDTDQQRREPYHRRHSNHKAVQDENPRDKILYNTFKTFSKYFMLSYFMAIIHLSVNLYYQYTMDIGRLQARQLQSEREKTTTTTTTNHSNQTTTNTVATYRALIQRLDTIIGESRQMLLFIGSPNSDLHFAVESYLMMEIIISMLIYIGPQFMLRYFFKLDLYHLRILSNYKRELQLCQRVINEQVTIYLQSSNNHARAFTNFWHGFKVTPVSSQKQEWDTNLTGANLTPPLGSINSGVCHGLNDRLIQMYYAYSFMPHNRSPGWIASWLNFLLALIVFNSVNNLVFEGFIIYSMYLSRSSKPMSEYNIMNWLVFYGSLIIFGGICIPATLYMIVFILILMDTEQMALHLGHLFDECILRNELKMDHQRIHIDQDKTTISRLLTDTKDGTSRNEVHLERVQEFIRRNKLEMNSDILYLLMHYKIFVRQIASQRVLFEYTVVSAVAVLSVLPIISGLHVPYFDDDLDPGVKLFLAIMNLCVCAPPSFGFIYACRIVCRANDLHKSMIRLLAHMIHVTRQDQFKHFYDAHLTLMLRREISAHVSFDEAFAVRGIKFNYGNLMRLYFWMGLTIIAVVSRTRLASHLTGTRSFFDDPLRIYR